MRKLIIKCRPHPIMIGEYQDLLENFESFELIELLKIDFEKGEKVGIVELMLKPGLKLEDIEFPESYEILGILKHEGPRYVLLGKVRAPKKLMPLFKMFDLDLVWTSPAKKTKNEVVVSVIGKEENLRKLLGMITKVSDVVDVSFQNVEVGTYDMLSCLTRKQKEVVTVARNNGYYEHPRRINAEELSKKIGISKATTLEHLRKAESRLMAVAFNGHG
ncbi:MAG: helix-turn-helix domain-containing protein [Methanobacteriota archaeon]|nr:MAG: helix-turn-helix domain-containing protein [Euryarchaeota archaeon]